MKISATTAVLVTTAAILGGCANGEPFVLHDGPARVERIEYGVVERIDMYREGQSSPSGVGAIVGGVAGGVIGHQIGSGGGNTAATIIGALGGAFIGNNIERANQRDRYRVTVRLDSGARLEITEVGEGELRVGDRVRVVNNRVSRA